MKTKKWSLLFVSGVLSLFLIIILTSCSESSSGGEGGVSTNTTIKGFVVSSSGEKIPGAKITASFNGNDYVAKSDENGYYSMSFRLESPAIAVFKTTAKSKQGSKSATLSPGEMRVDLPCE